MHTIVYYGLLHMVFDGIYIYIYISLPKLPEFRNSGSYPKVYPKVSAPIRLRAPVQEPLYSMCFVCACPNEPPYTLYAPNVFICCPKEPPSIILALSATFLATPIGVTTMGRELGRCAQTNLTIR